MPYVLKNQTKYLQNETIDPFINSKEKIEQYCGPYILKNQTNHLQKEKIDPFINIKERIKHYAINQRKVCAKYLGSTNPWLPLKPHLNVQYYYLDKNKRLGWCVNAKVSLSLIHI